MSFREVVASSAIKLKPLFDEVFRKTQEEAAADLHLLGQEKASRLADEFFIYLQANLELFNGADPELNTLIKRLQPYKSDRLRIERLLQKIIEDLRVQNRKLMDDSSQKVVPFSTSLAAFQLPILDTTQECAELSAQFLRKQKDNFSLSETLGMCCFLVAQNMQTQATLLFNFHTMRYFIENPQEFTKQLLEYVQEAELTLDPGAVQINVSILRNFFKTSIIESIWRDLLARTPPNLFKWMQNGGPGEKELFQGYEQLALQNYARAFEYYKQAASLSNSQALVKMGDCYWTGNGVPAKDYARAFECYEQAADLGNSRALVNMGDCYWTGHGVPAKDYARAFEYYKQAASLSSSRALVYMGNCYWTGDGVPAQDYARAFECYKQAADLGDSRALVEMGDCYWTGHGVPAQDHAKAFEYCTQAADLGNSQALVNMGYCYWTGSGVPAQDYARAFKCYEQAAALDNSQALVEMGHCYSTGKGVSQNAEQAFECWLTAKKMDNNYGALNVAKCLTVGRGTQKNREEAKAILLDLISRNVAAAAAFYAKNF